MNKYNENDQTMVKPMVKWAESLDIRSRDITYTEEEIFLYKKCR
jgi:hypothetical protein